MSKQNVTNKPTAIDLFAGAGGLSLGLQKAGFKVIGAVELDSVAAETYKANHNETFLWEIDIKNLQANEVFSKLKIKSGELDLLAGCPPCQGFSAMRTLKGAKVIRDVRNDLVFEFLRLAKELKPKCVMMENVPGLAFDKRMKVIINELKELGYECECNILDAAEYGVPQRRKRTILLGGRHGSIGFPKPIRNKKFVIDAIGHMPRPGNSGDPLHDFPERRTSKIAELISKIPKDGGGRLALGEENQLKCHTNFRGFLDVYGRMSWRKPSPTITGGCVNPSKGRFLHPHDNRAITLREAALLQTFPKNYFFSLRRGKTGAALMIGNALPPQFIKSISSRIFSYLMSIEYA